MRKKFKRIVAMIMVATILIGTNAYANLQETTTVNAENTKGITNATMGDEIVDKRTKFTKQFQMSDGSFTVISYSQPVHYKKNDSWNDIDMTLAKSKKYYKPKNSSLNIKIAQKSNKKSVITLKRSSYSLGWALDGKKVKSKKAKISNPKKEAVTDVMNHSKVTYKSVLKNTDIIYDIYPEKVQEIICINKKQKNQTLKFKINAKNLKVKVKGKRVNFVRKDGKKQYIRMATVVTDANGLSTTNVKISYNKKTKTLNVTPNKKWWNSKKRKFPIEIRTTYITSEHERDVKIGAAYGGAPDSNFGYDKSLLLQADKCLGYVKMNDIAELAEKSVQIRDAQLVIQNEKKLELSSGKTFDVSAYKVLEDWSENNLTFNNRPAYDSDKVSTVALKGIGKYSFDITEIVKVWYSGERNYGIALAAENGNKTYQARLDRNPYIMINYEKVGIDGAAYLTESNPITKKGIKIGQEDYYYIEGEKGITYDVYTDSDADTQAILYDADKEQIGYDDDSGLGKNFLLTGNFDKRTYIKVRTKDAGTGSYTIYLKQRFARPEPVGIDGRDKYTISWNKIEHAKDYQVCVYDSSGKIAEAVVTGTSYDYVYTKETRDKTLGFVVTAREGKELTGIASRMIFNRDRQSEWVYSTPMDESRKNIMAVSLNGKIYVLGGEDEDGSSRSFAMYDTAKKNWTELADYPGTDTGLCKAGMVTYNNEIYVIGGQTDTTSNARLLTAVYVYDIKNGKWTKKQDLKEGITDSAIAVSKGKVYAFTKAGLTDRIDVYDMKTDTWSTGTLPGNSTVVAAASVDGRVFVLKEDGEGMRFSEYLPEDNMFEDAGAVCPYAVSGYYSTPAVIGGSIYMVNERNTKEVLAYDAYTDTWSNISSMNLTKSNSTLVSSDNDVYSIGGEVAGFGIVDVVEQYTIDAKTIIKEINVNKGESYELQVNAANLKKGESQFVTLTVDPDVLEIKNSSSYHDEEELAAGIDGVKLVQYQPEKGVIVLELTGTMEQGNAYEACQSIPVEALESTKTKVEISMSDKLK